MSLLRYWRTFRVSTMRPEQKQGGQDTASRRHSQRPQQVAKRERDAIEQREAPLVAVQATPTLAGSHHAQTRGDIGGRRRDRQIQQSPANGIVIP